MGQNHLKNNIENYNYLINLKKLKSRLYQYINVNVNARTNTNVK
jgi:hypothetical protein